MKRMKTGLGLIVLFVSLLCTIGYANSINASVKSQLPAKVKLKSLPSQTNGLVPIPADAALKDMTAVDSVSPMCDKSQKKWTVDDLTGEYIHFFRTALTDEANGGGKVTLTKSTTDPNELVVTGFYGVSDPTLKFVIRFNPETQTVSFPVQVVLDKDDQWNGLVFTGITSEMKPDNKAVFESPIDDNGTFGFTALWGLVVKEGIFMNQPISVHNSLYFARSNGTLACKVPNGEDSYATVDEPVFVWKYADNDIMVENFFNNTGRPVQMKLNHDRSATIRSQIALSNSLGRGYTAAGKWENGNLVAYSKTIVTDRATSDNTISWNDWMFIFTNQDKVQYYGPIKDTQLKLSSGTFNFPNTTLTSFQGEGTESNPYKIKDVEDLKFLYYLVSETYDDNNDVAEAFTDKVFRQENDIDLKDVKFAPIGDSKTRFNGIYDGNNHSISNMSMIISGRHYVGLFGNAGSKSVLKNITLENAEVATNGMYVGALAGFSNGLIENCKIKSPKVYTAAYGIGGVAGIANQVTGSSVENGQLISAHGYIGGITAQVSSGKLSNCYTSEMAISSVGMSTDNYVPVGGIVGFLSESEMEDCYSTGLITTNENYLPMSIGGLAGQVKNGLISRCFFSGHISSPGLNSQSNVGGLVGVMSGNITDCYSTGRIDAPICTHAGGLTGYVLSYEPMGTKISNSFTAMSLNVKTFKYDAETEVRETLGTIADNAKPVAENMYYDSQITNYYSKTFDAASNTLASGILPTGFSSEIWTATEGQYPRLSKFADTEDSKFSATAYTFAEKNALNRVEENVKVNLLGNTKVKFFLAPDTYSDQGHYAKINSSNVIEPGTTNGIDTLFIMNGNRAFYHLISVAPLMYEGNGTAESPFLIKTKEQLINLSDVTTNNGQKYTGVYFSLANDIDMEYDSRFMGISATASANSFDGVFDGNGHTIHNLYLNGVGWKVKPEDAENGLGTGDSSKSKITYGFIGRLGKTGVLKNLSISSDADLSFWSTSAAFVGENNGLVENCRNYADIKAYFSWCGGIVGDNYATGVIKGCFNAGDIKGGNMQTGGISGQNRGIIEESMNVGNVELKQVITNTSATSYYCVGGITGRSYGGDVKNVLNTGAVSGNKQIGGISGSLPSASSTSTGTNSVLGAVSYGPVYANDVIKVGGIGGDTGTTSTTSIAYYDIQLAPYQANGGSPLTGVAGLSTSELTSGTPLNGLDASVWQFDAGMYPVLKRFADEPLAQKARQIIFNIPDNGNIRDIKKNIELTANNDLEYKLAQGTEFTIKDRTLVVPTAPKALAVDTLTINYGDVHKPLILQVYPTFPLDGEGTVEKPYIIANATDWNNLAGYTKLKNEDYAGKYFAITGELDFNGLAFSPMATNKDVPFQGKIDGGKHSMKGYDYTGEDKQTYVGLFGYLGDQSEISNLTLDGKISANGTYLGGLAASLAGKLENVIQKGTVSSDKADIGGLAAMVLGTAQFIDCSNEGVVESRSTSSINYIAGLAADVKAGAKFIRCTNTGTLKVPKASYIGGLISVAEAITIQDCENSGKFDITDPSVASYVGGILASAKNATTGKTYEISGCKNSSDISAKNEVAGIVGTVSNTTAGNVVLNISDCENSGKITSVSTSATYGIAAGIAGKYSAGSTIANCVNTGAITGMGGKSIGGILGVKANNSSATLPIIVTDCRNTAPITSKGYHVSGIMGGEMCAVTIDNCYNTGEIKSDLYMVGGIASYASIKGGEIQNCFNTGNVTAGQSMAGGILGSSTVQIDIIDCWNSGNIASTHTTAGTATAASNNIGGISGKGAGLVSYCHNTGTVKGLTQVGGLVGLPLKAITKFDNCYNAGTVDAPENQCGGIIGVNPETSTAWSTDNTVNSVYFASDMVKSTLTPVGTAIEYSSLLKTAPGEGWHSADEYSLPVSLAHKENKAAHVMAAQAVATEGNTLATITKDFFVGTPGKVEWSSNADITFDGNKAKIGLQSGKIILTVKSGDFSKNIEVTVLQGSSIDDLQSADNILDAVYYTLDGIKVPTPDKGDGKIYLVIVKYTDGTSAMFKIINK